MTVKNKFIDLAESYAIKNTFIHFEEGQVAAPCGSKSMPMASRFLLQQERETGQTNVQHQITPCSRLATTTEGAASRRSSHRRSSGLCSRRRSSEGSCSPVGSLTMTVKNTFIDFEVSRGTLFHRTRSMFAVCAQSHGTKLHTTAAKAAEATLTISPVDMTVNLNMTVSADAVQPRRSDSCYNSLAVEKTLIDAVDPPGAHCGRTRSMSTACAQQHGTELYATAANMGHSPLPASPVDITSNVNMTVSAEVTQPRSSDPWLSSCGDGEDPRGANAFACSERAVADLSIPNIVEPLNWSKGSLGHSQGTCNPCAHAWRRSGCSKGAECEYCHLCDSKAFHARKRTVRRKRTCQSQCSALCSAMFPPTLDLPAEEKVVRTT
jgi:hypothetical protein